MKIFKIAISFLTTIMMVSSSMPKLITFADTSTLTDPFEYSQNYLDDTGVTSVIDNKNTKTTKVRVAIYDSGFDITHNDLLGSLCSNATTLTMGDTTSGHGTGVMSVIAMTNNNGIGGSGVCPNVEIYPISGNNSVISNCYPYQES